METKIEVQRPFRTTSSTFCIRKTSTYRAVEDHEAVVEVVMLHGGVAVELG